MECCTDILAGPPEKLPPLREVNHMIPLIDKAKKYQYYTPKCPDSMKPQLLEKIKQYQQLGWWERQTATQAVPMLCVLKKDGSLRTTIDCRKRNENIYKDVTPFPDQEHIQLNMVHKRVHSKINLSNTYEQVRTISGDVWKSVFATVFETFVSNVMQQSDCNAPSTF